MKFQIKYLTTQKVTGCAPRGDELARHAVHAFGHVLNTEARRNRTYGARKFAEIIESVYDARDEHIAAVCTHLRTLEPQPQSQTV